MATECVNFWANCQRKKSPPAVFDPELRPKGAQGRREAAEKSDSLLGTVRDFLGDPRRPLWLNSFELLGLLRVLRYFAVRRFWLSAMPSCVDETVLVNGTSRSRRRSWESPTSPVFYAGKARLLPACGKGQKRSQYVPNSYQSGRKWVRSVSELVQIASSFPAPL